MTDLPLSPYKVVDLTRVRSGPTCVRQLADWGADVIKVEAAGEDALQGGARESIRLPESPPQQARDGARPQIERGRRRS